MPACLEVAVDKVCLIAPLGVSILTGHSAILAPRFSYAIMPETHDAILAIRSRQATRKDGPNGFATYVNPAAIQLS